MKGRKLYAVLAAIWFILTGLLQVTTFSFELERVVMGVLALAVGALFFLDK